MNRIQPLVDGDRDRSLANSAAQATEGASGAPHIELEGCHCIFTPKHYERNYAYPLIVWLHGPDDDERQVTRVMPHVSDRNYVAVGPRGTVVARRPGVGYRWVQSADEIERAERRVWNAIEDVRRWLNIAPRRIFLAGYEAGGTMAFRLALSRPEAFAGVLSFGGQFPQSLRPLANLSSARRMKIFLASGREASEYSQAEVCRDLRLFHAAGMTVCLRSYPGGDDLTTCMLADMDRWIMEQVAPQPVSHDECSRRK
ncbi:MAG: alpha/beta hydrolase [Pirellulales bacterium]